MIENFNLIGFSYKNGVVRVKYQDSDSENAISHTVVYSNQPHPDLIGLLEKFDLVVRDGFGMKEETVFHIFGVEILGSQDNQSLKVSALLETFYSKEITLKSPSIRIKQDEIGFEEIIRDNIEQLKEEVYKYVFKNKRAQLALFEEEE